MIPLCILHALNMSCYKSSRENEKKRNKGKKGTHFFKVIGLNYVDNDVDYALA